jgi:hypothetical protein
MHMFSISLSKSLAVCSFGRIAEFPSLSFPITISISMSSFLILLVCLFVASPLEFPVFFFRLHLSRFLLRGGDKFLIGVGYC